MGCSPSLQLEFIGREEGREGVREKNMRNKMKKSSLFGVRAIKT